MRQSQAKAFIVMDLAIGPIAVFRDIEVAKRYIERIVETRPDRPKDLLEIVECPYKPIEIDKTRI